MTTVVMILSIFCASFSTWAMGSEEIKTLTIENAKLVVENNKLEIKYLELEKIALEYEISLLKIVIGFPSLEKKSAMSCRKNLKEKERCLAFVREEIKKEKQELQEAEKNLHEARIVQDLPGNISQNQN